MVAILRILFTTAAVLFASLPVLANPAPAIVPASLEAIHKLTKRQSSATTPKVDLNKLPEECKPVCKETNDKFSAALAILNPNLAVILGDFDVRTVSMKEDLSETKIVVKALPKTEDIKDIKPKGTLNGSLVIKEDDAHKVEDNLKVDGDNLRSSPGAQLMFGMFKAEPCTADATNIKVEKLERDEVKNLSHEGSIPAEVIDDPMPADIIDDPQAIPADTMDDPIPEGILNDPLPAVIIDDAIIEGLDVQADVHDLDSVDAPSPTHEGERAYTPVREDTPSALLNDDIITPISSPRQTPVADAIDESTEVRQPKRRRVYMEAVEVLDLEAVYSQPVTFRPSEETIKMLNEKMKKLENPNVKKKEGRGLSMDTVRDRLLPIGLDPYPISLERSIQDVTITRKFLSAHYGGNTQATFPTIRRALLNEHGLDDFMYPNLDFNPHAPEMPGAPGLFFAADGEAAHDWPEIERVITRIRQGIWQYQGQYKMTPAPSLTKAEWACQKSKVRDTWARKINEKGWGRVVRARIHLRKTLGRPFTKTEFEKAMASSREYKEIVPAEIAQALLRGDESIAVWTMKCVGYDIDFQRNLADKFPTWVPPPPKKKKENSGKTRKKTVKKETKEVKIGKKRKRADLDVESESEPEDSDEDVDDSEEEEELMYRPRGTRSRPIVLM
ncbi:hypothetical protein D9615_008076 [Tricholomella constricta]|uniref:DUF6697 domain-containing protein n=1 Tax=Tricholomella constricta TaxID=117010 RepID=A0A8H5GWE0_9AGAR|nr:hypothetical protein D9615_008076 [Tricholomella constricta]